MEWWTSSSSRSKRRFTNSKWNCNTSFNKLSKFLPPGRFHVNLFFRILNKIFLTLLDASSFHCLQFPKLCGMTGTAATESTEFESIYKLKVTIVPTNKPMIRKVLISLLFIIDFWNVANSFFINEKVSFLVKKIWPITFSYLSGTWAYYNGGNNHCETFYCHVLHTLHVCLFLYAEGLQF